MIIMKIGLGIYGGDHINVIHSGDTAIVTVGKFCSIAGNINIFLGGGIEQIGLVRTLLDT